MSVVQSQLDEKIFLEANIYYNDNICNWFLKLSVAEAIDTRELKHLIKNSFLKLHANIEPTTNLGDVDEFGWIGDTFSATAEPIESPNFKHKLDKYFNLNSNGVKYYYSYTYEKKKRKGRCKSFTPYFLENGGLDMYLTWYLIDNMKTKAPIQDSLGILKSPHDNITTWSEFNTFISGPDTERDPVINKLNIVLNTSDEEYYDDFSREILFRKFIVKDALDKCVMFLDVNLNGNLIGNYCTLKPNIYGIFIKLIPNDDETCNKMRLELTNILLNFKTIVVGPVSTVISPKLEYWTSVVTTTTGLISNEETIFGIPDVNGWIGNFCNFILYLPTNHLTDTLGSPVGMGKFSNVFNV
jgi:hypothetical protein